MLRELSIRNFAIIDDLTIRFDDGLTILSGETGAGKSIIVNAVNLLLGSRVSAKMIRDGCESAELSAFFDVPRTSAAATLMAENGYAADDGLLVRRVIAANDRHRIYINDRMATMQMLAAMTADLACISGQHAHQGLLREETHLDILDRFGHLDPLVKRLGGLYHQMVPLAKQIERLQVQKESQEKEIELLRFQADEIDDADISPGEDDSLEQERQRLKHAETLIGSVQTAIARLYGDPGAILEQLVEVRKLLDRSLQVDPELTEAVSTLSDHLYGLEDVTDTLRSYLGSLDTDMGRLEPVEARLDQLNRLKRKYGGTLEALFQRRKEIETQLQAIDSLDDDITHRQRELTDLHGRAAAMARQLSEKRGQAAAAFARCVEDELRSLRMAGTRFGVHLTQAACPSPASAWLCVDECALSATGIDQAAFMIAPNVGESLKPLSAIASGGELSRVVLALKAILAETDSVGAIIFDEVDAGIGGAVADVVGKKLEALSKKHQLICITHLHQIARFGDHHYYIEKQVKKGRTITRIQPMDREARIREIARMLGGEKITPAALEHARSLVAG